MATKVAEREAEQARASLDALIDGAKEAGEAGAALKRRLQALEKSVSDKAAKLAALKTKLASDAKAKKEAVTREMRTKLTTAQEQHRRVSGLLDELLGRVHRVKDTIV